VAIADLFCGSMAHANGWLKSILTISWFTSRIMPLNLLPFCSDMGIVLPI